MNQKRRHVQLFAQSSKLVTSAVVKPIFKLDDFIQGKGTRYLSRHSSTLVAFSNHLLSFSAMLPATWYNSSSFSTRPVPVRNAARPWSPSSAARCQRSKSFVSFMKSILLTSVPSGEQRVRREKNTIWKNWIDLKKNKSWWNKLVKRRLQMVPNAGAFLETVGATLRFRVWKWTMNDAATIGKKNNKAKVEY